MRLAEAPSHGIPVLHLDKHSKGAQAYLALAGEMLRRMEARRLRRRAGSARLTATAMQETTMIRPKGLGRGLDALLSGARRAAAARIAADARHRPPAAGQVPAAHAHGRGVARRARGIDPRAGRSCSRSSCARSTAARFEIIAGERRWRAAQRAGLTEVPALVRAVPDQAALALALIENIQREDLNPLEEAQGLSA